MGGQAMDWNDRLVVVTGAGGFIGSHLVETLIAKGACVRALVHYNSRNDPGLLALLEANLLEGLEIVFGDLRDPFSVRKLVGGAWRVFHLGALISIPYSYCSPHDVVQTNLMGTLHILQACLDGGVERLIHTSSSEVYGTARTVPIDENHPLQGQSPYSASKIGADMLAHSYFCAFDLPLVTVRPFNTYGPRQSARAVIPTIIAQCLSGDRICLGNLEARRDFTYVSDTVQGLIQAAQAPGIEGRTFNLGSGLDISIGELARLVVELAHRPVRVEVDPERLRPEKSEVGRLLADATQARQELGWEPTVSLEDGLKRTMAWMAEHLGLYSGAGYQF
jgi:NAD dependent epimerase/dehydratase